MLHHIKEHQSFCALTLWYRTSALVRTCVCQLKPSAIHAITWFIAKLRQLHQVKEEARSGDRILHNQARNTMTKEIRVAKRSLAEKLKNRFLATTLCQCGDVQQSSWSPKKTSITGFSDDRPVALTSVVMKSFERLVLGHLKDAPWANRSVDDAVNAGLHYILQHLNSPGTCARILLVDLSSALNTIISEVLCSKLTQFIVPDIACQWITNFLTDRRQQVRLGKITSSTRTISTGASGILQANS